MPGITRAQDTLVCDNGGFEDGFNYYFGFVSDFYDSGTGSSTCAPKKGGIPCVFSPHSMPSTNRFELVSSGLDPVVFINKVLFGTKSLRLNSYCSTSGDCNHGAEIDRIKKRFRVTSANRNFTVWYSAIIEDPAIHGNADNQPFFSIKCDLAPTSSNICYDGNTFMSQTASRGLILGCNQYDSLCYREGDVVKFTDWVCHRIIIPKEHIGSIATLEITAADCGAAGGHFGYVYIDGICEQCDGSKYGSGTLNDKPDIILSCDGDSITIKGRYTTPSFNGYNILHAITVPGFNTYGMSINTSTKTFSFRIVKSDFESPNDECRDVITYLDFKNSGGDHLPLVPTNGVEICLEDFDLPKVDITIGGCNRNDPTNSIFSDDYYYVEFDLSNAENQSWTLERLLDDPHPGETGKYFLNTTGYGNGYYNLGPFLIQEGSWVLIFNHEHCSDTFQINPPDYCSGCGALAEAKIFDIACTQGNNWTYKINIPSNGVQNEYYKIDGMDYYFGVDNTFNPGAIGENCLEVTMEYYIGINRICSAIFDICPPRKCSNNSGCNLESYIKKLNCLSNGDSFSIDLILKGASSPCLRAVNNAGNNVTINHLNPVGNFAEDITLRIYVCENPSFCPCSTATNCYKVMKIRKPMDCNRSDFGGGHYTQTANVLKDDIWIVPNPVNSDEFIIGSNLLYSEFEIINSSGLKLYTTKFEGKEHKVNLKIPPGFYFVQYRNQNNKVNSIKFVKF